MSTERTELSAKEIQRLTVLHGDARLELAHRRKREVQVFLWSSVIMLAFVSAVLLAPSKPVLFTLPRNGGSLLASILFIGLAVFSISWQHKQRRKAEIAVKALLSILEKLGAFEVYPDEWKPKGERHDGAGGLGPSKILATALLGVLGILVAWLYA